MLNGLQAEKSDATHGNIFELVISQKPWIKWGASLYHQIPNSILRAGQLERDGSRHGSESI